MKRILATLMLAVAITATAQQVLTAHSRIMLGGAATARRVAATSGGEATYKAFVQVDDIAALRQAGVAVNTITGDVATVQLTSNQAMRLASTRGVKCISLAQRLTLENDSARIVSGIDEVQQGMVGNRAYTGKGVIVGVIDTGVDFNHINLCDDQGRSRVIAAYLPESDNGEHPEVDGMELPGSHYDTPEQIAALTADNVNESHGTHTSGTAAGSYRANGWHGVAPEADLVVCAMPDSALTDVNVANSVLYIMDVARREGKPCVINMSIGNASGPHDGTSMLCRLFDRVSGPGRICVVSSANSAARACVLDHRFATGTDTVRTAIVPYSGLANGFFTSYVSTWSRDGKPNHVEFTAVSRSSGEVLCSWTVPPTVGDEPVTFDVVTDEQFARYFAEGSIRATSGVESCNGNYHTLAEFRVKPVSDDILLGMTLVADADTRMTTWGGSNVTFGNYKHPNLTAGTKDMAVSDLATGDEAISVGAYCTRKYMPLADGTNLESRRSTVGEIAYFSGYGPDMRGIARPDVCAPGFSLVSSVSRYDMATAYAHNWAAPSVTVNGEVYPYASQYGTSMSTPVVVGAIALWLQIDPKLTPEQIRKLMAETSVHDKYTNAAPKKWGSGKLDVAAATRALQQRAVVTGIESNRLSLTANAGNGEIAIKGVDGAARLVVIDAQGRVVLSRTIHSDGTVQMDRGLAPGVYIATVATARGRVATPFIVKW